LHNPNFLLSCIQISDGITGFQVPCIPGDDDGNLGDDYHRKPRYNYNYHNGSCKSMVVVITTNTIGSFVTIDEKMELMTTSTCSHRLAFTAAMLHCEVMNRLRHEKLERQEKGRKFEGRKTLIHVISTKDPKARSVELYIRRIGRNLSMQ
jgi:hypothetical protein